MMKDAFAGKGIPVAVCAAGFLALIQCALGADMETRLWQGRIDACAKAGGGRVVVPAGTHVVGQLYLRSNVELHLEEGATLQGARGLHNYILHRLPYSEGDWAAVVMGLNVTNVAITGRGEIYGDGAGFEHVRAHGICTEGFRPRGIFLSQSKGIRLEDFTLRDSACWGIVFKCCDRITARRVRIDSHANGNNDGFDIEASNALFEHCDVDSSDDAFVLKSNDPSFAVTNVTVRDCIARTHCCALKLGTVSHGIMSDIRFERCRVEPPRRDFVDRRSTNASDSANPKHMFRFIIPQSF